MATVDAVTVPVKFEVDGFEGATTVRAGDKLVLAFRDYLSDADMHHVRAKFEAVMPDVECVIVCGCSGIAVERGEEIEIAGPSVDDLRDLDSREGERWHE